ncbi:transmembrane protein 33, isoform CRA_b [Mus musculus]|nr:transmembrane protein 33, isoform CRA_b [Mus musculus]
MADTTPNGPQGAGAVVRSIMCGGRRTTYSYKFSTSTVVSGFTPRSSALGACAFTSGPS